MLTPTPTTDPQSPRNPRRERRLWHDSERYAPSLGCHGCPEKTLCGGLSIRRNMFSCLDFCCGKPEQCDVVCRQHPDFALRVREVGGFDLNTVPRTVPISSSDLPAVVPMVFHRTSRACAFDSPATALSLYQLFHRRTGQLRFSSRNELIETFGLAPNTRLVLTGTDQDPPIEGWWKLSEGRRRIIRELRELGIEFATTPNYSLFIDQPRWDDLHAMKRIGLVHEEFQSEGLSTALHVNARTETDMQRWTEYIGSRPEITHIAYEFATGTGWAGRQGIHARWLAGMAGAIGRPLHLVVRGGIDVLPMLANAFTRVSLVETSIFMKTMKRRRAVLDETGTLRWEPALTPAGALLDALLAENYVTVERWLRPIATPSRIERRVAFG
ncbi:DUF4417 domain-containing protein [Chelatococcus sp. XZ-Ab1]|uniref:DUF4417 domain-containing protein n=1 Tax=Chelatococcus sp. XZ-Ab1 TaxID=3034027 RepID=UPI0023E3D44A|nr:DUF4417 domain-containing protein [Chelatococcus sp. XZ-Ab1]